MSERPRRLRWWGAPTALPKHPYRDTLIVYGLFAGLVVVLGVVTGGSLRKAVTAAVVVFVVATAWSMLAWRRRLRAAVRESEREEVSK